MSYQDSIASEILCPNCGEELIKTGTCYACPTCGYKECGR